jgi:hypothetical protein
MFVGLSSQQDAQQVVGYASTTASIAVSGAAAAGLIPLTAVPFIGPAIAAAALVAMVLIRNSGCGRTCILTSEWANQAAEILQQNSDAYFALPTPRAPENQKLALDTFDKIWEQFVKLCNTAEAGDAGKTAIADRQAGACKWKQNRGGGHPGEPAMGACWNWFNGYRDPIAADQTAAAGAFAALLPAGALDSETLLYGGAALLVASLLL